MPKTTEQHTDIYYARVDAVVLLILKNDKYMQSKRNGELTDIVKEQFGLGDVKQAQRYIRDAKAEIRRLGKAKKEKAFARAMRDREYIIIANKGTDDRLALDAMKDRDKIFGLYVDESNVNFNASVKVVKDNI